jgi:peptidoglycan/xylan/chitin deacetylase (PgdA/CDA1 family)
VRFRLPGRRYSRAQRSSPGQLGCVLVYHTVADRPGDPRYELVPALATRTFEEQLLHLRSRYHLVPPSRLVEAASERRSRDPLPVAITFDDDLPSHVDVVAPTLLRSGVPAAFFLCGASIGTPHSFWWQDLQTVVDRHRDGAIPLQLRSLPELDFGPAVRGTPHAIHHAAELIERLPPEQRDAVAAELHTQAGQPDLGLSADHIEALAGGGFEIGFHTWRHHPLPTLDDRALRAAMYDGRDRLEAVVGRPLTMIAYPHGKADSRVPEVTRAAGYELGFTTAAAAVGPGSDALMIGRIDVSAVDLPEFSRRIASVLARGPV